MKDIYPELLADYRRWEKLIGEDKYNGPKTLGIYDVLQAHYLIVDYFSLKGEGIGGVGPRNLNLLHSTLARQESSYEGVKKWTNSFEICATLFYGIIKNHVFHDGNKRTAFLSMLYHLWKIGRIPTAKHKEYEMLAVRVASNNLDHYPHFRDYKGTDSEVRFLAEYFRKNSRNMDKKQYMITYRQLGTILLRFGYKLANPDGNQINIVREREETYFKFLQRRTRIVEKNIGTIPFPGWTRQVAKGEIERIRKLTYLTPENGFDSDVFFHGMDPLGALIDQFSEPLRRLADK